MFRQKTSIFLLILLLGAFALRFLAVVALRNPHTFHGMQAGADAVEYNRLALNLASGAGYTIHPGTPTAFRAPGFPLLLAGVYRISYEGYLLAYLTQCLLGSLTCLLIYWLARELVSERSARIAAVLSALYFPSIYSCTVFMSETLFSACLALGLVALIRYMRLGGIPYLVLSALALGWSTLTRPFSILLLPLFVIVVAAGMMRKGRLRLAPLVVFTAVFLSVVAPWSIRNYLVYRQVVLLTTNGGSTFYGANNDRVLHEFRLLGGWTSTVELPGRAAIDATPDEVSHDRLEWKLGIEWVRSHLANMPILESYKFVRFWLPDISSQNRKFVLMDTIGYTPFLLLILIGAGRCIRGREYRSGPWWVLHVTMLAAIFTALIFWGSPRFRDGNAPALLVYAALAWRSKAGLPSGLAVLDGHTDSRERIASATVKV
jgi:4-amino-4-deoxy-L-arabinose transferase-like glycosyltransferase